LNVDRVPVRAVIAPVVRLLGEEGTPEARLLELRRVRLVLLPLHAEVWVDGVDNVRQLLQIVQVRDVVHGCGSLRPNVLPSHHLHRLPVDVERHGRLHLLLVRVLGTAYVHGRL